jgi:putative phosphoesterase
MDRKALRVFVLADTHNHLPENLEALADDVDEIWHLGDVCAPSLLVRLESLGPPVTLVRGNCDANFEWPVTVDLERNGVRFRLVHVPPSSTPENIDVLLHAHTHVPRHEHQDGVLFLNPGCVTRPDKGAPPSIATLEITAQGKILWRVTRLR